MALNTNKSKQEVSLIGLLVGGDLDSSILLVHSLDVGCRVGGHSVRRDQIEHAWAVTNELIGR